ncbi:MAG: 5-oxoprolinase subunit PxpB [Stenotrophomonas sp.]
MSLDAWTVEPLGEDGILLRLGSGIEAQINPRVHELADRIAALRPEYLRDIVPAYASLGLFVDLEHRQVCGRSPTEVLAPLLAQLGNTSTPHAGRSPPPVIEIAVCYCADCAPDLAEVAAHTCMDHDEVIERHSGALYTVAMIGFAPGFPYLLGLDPALAMPRKASPRTLVPAGSVAIGGNQTGIYPSQSPGGWQLIGRTSARLFDPRRAAPTLLQPGQQLRFVPVSHEHSLRANEGAQR